MNVIDGGHEPVGEDVDEVSVVVEDRRNDTIARIERLVVTHNF